MLLFVTLLLLFRAPDCAVCELDARQANLLHALADVARALLGLDEDLLRERLRSAHGYLLLDLQVITLQLSPAYALDEEVIPLNQLDGLRARVLQSELRR